MSEWAVMLGSSRAGRAEGEETMTRPSKSRFSIEVSVDGKDVPLDKAADALLAPHLERLAEIEQRTDGLRYLACETDPVGDRDETCCLRLHFELNREGYSVRCSLERALGAMLGENDETYATIARAYYGLAILHIANGVFSPGPSRMFLYVDGDDLREGETNISAAEAGLLTVNVSTR